MDRSDLKPCLRCRNPEPTEIIEAYPGKVISCECGLSSPSFDTWEDAISWWNTRPESGWISVKDRLPEVERAYQQGRKIVSVLDNAYPIITDDCEKLHEALDILYEACGGNTK